MVFIVGSFTPQIRALKLAYLTSSVYTICIPHCPKNILSIHCPKKVFPLDKRISFHSWSRCNDINNHNRLGFYAEIQIFVWDSASVPLGPKQQGGGGGQLCHPKKAKNLDPL